MNGLSTLVSNMILLTVASNIVLLLIWQTTQELTTTSLSSRTNNGVWTVSVAASAYASSQHDRSIATARAKHDQEVVMFSRNRDKEQESRGMMQQRHDEIKTHNNNVRNKFSMFLKQRQQKTPRRSLRRKLRIRTHSRNRYREHSVDEEDENAFNTRTETISSILNHQEQSLQDLQKQDSSISVEESNVQEQQEEESYTMWKQRYDNELRRQSYTAVWHFHGWWARQPWSAFGGDSFSRIAEAWNVTAIFEVSTFSSSNIDGTISVTMYNNRDMLFQMNILGGLDSNCLPNNFATLSSPESCTVEIHEGTKCDDPGSALYDSSRILWTNGNPWPIVKYIADPETLSSSTSIQMYNGGNGYNCFDNMDRALVVYDSTGASLGCGILQLVEGCQSTIDDNLETSSPTVEADGPSSPALSPATSPNLDIPTLSPAAALDPTEKQQPNDNNTPASVPVLSPLSPSVFFPTLPPDEATPSVGTGPSAPIVSIPTAPVVPTAPYYVLPPGGGAPLSPNNNLIPTPPVARPPNIVNPLLPSVVLVPTIVIRPTFPTIPLRPVLIPSAPVIIPQPSIGRPTIINPPFSVPSSSNDDPTQSPTISMSPSISSPPSLSASPSTSPSVSFHPSISSAPTGVDKTVPPSTSLVPTISSKPSVSPTISFHPTISSKPSVSPTISFHPTVSSKPSASPTKLNNTVPPSISFLPTTSSKPSVSPTKSVPPTKSSPPTREKTTPPSVSMRPTISPRPSSKPSLSSKPTITIKPSVSPTKTASPSVSSKPTKSQTQIADDDQLILDLRDADSNLKDVLRTQSISSFEEDEPLKKVDDNKRQSDDDNEKKGMDLVELSSMYTSSSNEKENLLSSSTMSSSSSSSSSSQRGSFSVFFVFTTTTVIFIYHCVF